MFNMNHNLSVSWLIGTRSHLFFHRLLSQQFNTFLVRTLIIIIDTIIMERASLKSSFSCWWWLTFHVCWFILEIDLSTSILRHVSTNQLNESVWFLFGKFLHWFLEISKSKVILRLLEITKSSDYQSLCEVHAVGKSLSSAFSKIN